MRPCGPQSKFPCNAVILPAKTVLSTIMAKSNSLHSRIAAAACIGLTAVTLEVIRRWRRGPIRKTPPVPDESPYKVMFGKGHCAVDTVPESDLMDPPITREDPFFWMRDDTRKDPKVLSHLRAENAFTNYKTLSLKELRHDIYNELLSHYVETDSTVPAPRGTFAYYTKTIAGKSYKYYCRRPKLEDGSLGNEEILLDVNAIAIGLSHCDVRKCVVSPDDKLMAYSIDTSGYETYDIRIFDLNSRQIISSHTINGTTGSFEWGKDSSTMFYSTMDKAHRPYKLWRREFSDKLSSSGDASAGMDTCLYTETDSEYYLHASKSRSGRLLIVASMASMTTEQQFIDLDDASLQLRAVAGRVPNVLYEISHARGDDIYVITNRDGATNFKVMKTSIQSPSEWHEFLAYNPLRTSDFITSFETFAIILGREDGFRQMWILPDHDIKKMYRLPTEDTSHLVEMESNLEYDARTFRYTYSSLTAPRRVFEIDVSTKEIKLLKQDDVPEYDESLYQTERLEATSNDGTKVPISLVYKAETGEKTKARKTLLYGYGSYEISMEPSFAMTRLPLLDRGVAYAIAHVRGGGEFGREWYEAARMEDKKKTFEDFIACAQFLVDSGRTKPEWMAMEGRSAGGLLVGAVANMRPDLFRAAVAGVPFVDVLNTMSDATIPLTTGEWQEWGNPHTKKYFDAILEYCPYSNVAKKPYPAMLVLAGLFDPRVMYSEPAKWVAKLRKFTTSDNDILFKVDLSSGHFSASNRYQYLEEKAFELSWVLDQLGAVVSDESTSD